MEEHETVLQLQFDTLSKVRFMDPDHITEHTGAKLIFVKYSKLLNLDRFKCEFWQSDFRREK